MAKTAWGIELGTSSVKAVRISGDRGSATLEEVEILSLRDFGQTSGSNHDAATTAALADLRSRKGIRKGDQVFVSISGQNTLGRIISLPPVSDDRIRETILNEARSQIPIKLEEAVWDYQVIEDADPDERKVNLYAAKKEAVEKIVQVCEGAGLQVTGIQVAPLGIYNYIKYELDDAVSDCCVAIDIGADNTDVVLIDGQKTYVRVVPVAGNDITKALRAKFKLSADQAEKLKRNAAKSKDAAAVFEAMKPPLKEMVGEIYRAVGFYKSQNEEANINQLVMMGNGSKLLNIKKFFEQQLQYQVSKVDAPQRVGLSRTVDPTEVQANIQSLTVAIGLALQAIGVDGLNRINLIPPEYVTAKETEKLRTPFYVGGGIAAAGGLIALVVAILSTSGVQSLLSTADGVAKGAGQQQAQFAAASSIGEEEAKAKSLNNVFRGVVAVVPARKMKDDDGVEQDIPEKPLTVQGAEWVRITTDALHSSLQLYIGQTSNGSPRPQIYYANVPNPGPPNMSGFNSSTFWMNQTMVGQSLYLNAPGETEGGVYGPTRMFEAQAYIASEIDPNGNDVVRASSTAVTGVLVPPEDEGKSLKTGLLRQEVRARLMKHFEETGQLRNVPPEVQDTIVFSGVDITADWVRNNASGGDFQLSAMMPPQNYWEVDGKATPSPVNTAGPSAPLAVTKISIKVTLKAIGPQPAE